MITRELTIAYYEKMKRKLYKSLKKNKIEITLQQLRVIADYLYETNISFFDDELENIINNISNQYFQAKDVDVVQERIMLYDYFSLDTRGLSLIYIDAIKRLNYELIYVCYEHNCNEKSKRIIKSVQSYSSGKIVVIKKSNKLSEQITQFLNIIGTERPCKILAQSHPSDVVGITVLSSFKTKIERYMINITDHAFWLGTKAVDYSIEFRDFGYLVSRDYRGFEEEQLMILPYYPRKSETPFAGFPFNINNKKLILSGGAVYKTKGSPIFLEIIDYILSNYEETIFLYLGNDAESSFKAFIIEKHYEKRFFVLPERNDLDEVMKHCYFYLSTYPILGGLMYQYAVANNKIPLSLAFANLIEENSNIARSNDLDDLFVTKNTFNFVFEHKDSLLNEIDKLISDEQYCKQKSESISNLIIKEGVFSEELNNALLNHKTNFDCRHISAETEKNVDCYLNVYSKVKVKWRYFQVIILPHKILTRTLNCLIDLMRFINKLLNNKLF